MPDYTSEQRRLWDVELEILDVFHKVCEDNNLKYSLALGTLLGAVRHKGFIPWDDDLDVMMPREDYEKLKRIWASVAPEQYVLQDEDVYDDYANNFSKIRKDHTTFLQFESERTASYQPGIFIDVFPLDRCAPGKVSQKIQQLLFLLNLLFNRGYTSGHGGLIGFVEGILLRVVPQKKYRTVSKWAGERSRRWNENEALSLVSAGTFEDCFRTFSATLFNRRVSLPFEGRNYYAVSDYDAFLKIQYGDYMTLPPAEEQVWKHQPILIDFENNYDELTH